MTHSGPLPKSTWVVSIGKEKLLSIDPVACDGGLPFGGNKPVDKSLPLFRLHIMFLWINQDHAVLIEELRVALHQEFEVLLILIGEAQNRNGDIFLVRGYPPQSGIQGAGSSLCNHVWAKGIKVGCAFPERALRVINRSCSVESQAAVASAAPHWLQA